MKAFNRYLIFFIIVAIGLVVSWGKLGQNRDELLTGSDSDTELLLPERDCYPWQAPCAAFGAAQALVLGPYKEGLMLKYQSSQGGAVISLSADYIDEHGKVLLQPLLLRQIAAHEWLLSAPPKGILAKRLRVKLESVSNKAITIFDL